MGKPFLKQNDVTGAMGNPFLGREYSWSGVFMCLYYMYYYAFLCVYVYVCVCECVCVCVYVCVCVGAECCESNTHGVCVCFFSILVQVFKNSYLL